MFKSYKQSFYGFGLLMLIMAYTCTSSCVATKNLLYFKDIPDTLSTPMVINSTPFVDPKIESNDILAITVQTLVQSPGNTPITTNSPGTFNLMNGNLVDKNGYIELSLIGFVKVGGLTTAEARELIKQKAKDVYKDPVVNVRIANFEVTVLGDVGRPGKITLPSEKGNVIDAIALASDMNLTAKKSNVLLIRHEGDKTIFSRYDLRTTKVFQSPQYWLRQGDQIIVEPNKFKAQSSDQSFLRNLGIVSTLISMVSLVLIFRNIK
jgi:polysaccharide biosynthesis/export protein